ncbi:unnamed protein product [Timema podura]|uniref:C2 domain-containing protein n=1 Tax=Timema podura TaxID=61482 RepID=A0ABN7NJX9_TIMPD|nr:unnamed protein product [Timema podura]
MDLIVDDEHIEFQDLTVFTKVFDYDRFSRNDVVGEVTIGMEELDVSSNVEIWGEITKNKKCNHINSTGNSVRGTHRSLGIKYRVPEEGFGTFVGPALAYRKPLDPKGLVEPSSWSWKDRKSPRE